MNSINSPIADAIKGSAPAEPTYSEEQLIAADLHYMNNREARERAALQADLDIAAGKFTGLYQMRRDDRAVREQQQRLGQTFGGGL